MRMTSLALPLTCLLVVIASTTTRGASVTIADLQQPKVHPFAPSEVRLLPGAFKEAQDRDLEYLLLLDPNRLLSGFRTQAGLTPKAKYYGGWESGGVRGQTLGHYLSALSFAYAATGDDQYKQRAHYCVTELNACQQARKTGLLAAYDQSDRIFDELTHGNIRTAPGDLNGGWVPWYTNHKVLAGLRDTYLLLDDQEGRVVLLRFADWCVDFTSKLTDEQLQRMFETEFGGMNEVLTDCYAISGDPKYLACAKRWYHHAVLDPLEQQHDDFSGLHANTQIPKVIGLARLHEITGDSPFAAASTFFWDTMVNHHSFANGGNSVDEHLGPPDLLAGSINGATAETCNVYNMLKLTRHLFAWTSDIKYADYYERALFNQILASQEPNQGMVTYFQRFSAGAHKDYSTPFDSFWCCVGTGLENHVTYNTAIYYHSGPQLYVNLFISSKLSWQEQGVSVTQETQFPESDTTQLKISTLSTKRLTLFLRKPEWTTSPIVKVNGTVIPTMTDEHAGYVNITRDFSDGDLIQYTMPMSLHVRRLPDKPTEVAFFYGPVMLAGIQDSVELLQTPTVFVGSADQPNSLLAPDTAAPLEFKSLAAQPHNLKLIPFYKTHHVAYQVYFDTFTEKQWSIQQARYTWEQDQAKKLDAAVIDTVLPAQQQSEVDHHMRESHTQFGGGAENKWRHVLPGGFLEYTLKVDPTLQNRLLIQWFGGDRDRVFDLFIDNQLLAEVSHDAQLPGQMLSISYSIPLSSTQGHQTVVFRLAPKGNTIAGGLYGARMIAANEDVLPFSLQATDSYLPPPGGPASVTDKYHGLSGDDLAAGSISSTNHWRQSRGALSFTLANNPMVHSCLKLSFVADRQTRNATLFVNNTKVGDISIPGDSNDLWANRTIELPDDLTTNQLYQRIELRTTLGDLTPRLTEAWLLPQGQHSTTVTDFVHAGNLKMEAQKLIEVSDTRSGSDLAGARWRYTTGGVINYHLGVDPVNQNRLRVFYHTKADHVRLHIEIDGKQAIDDLLAASDTNTSKLYVLPIALTQYKNWVALKITGAPRETSPDIVGLILEH